MSVHKRIYKRKNASVSTYYLAVVKVKGRPTLTKQFERKIDAEAWEREQRVKSVNEPRQVAANAQMTLIELAAYWFETHVRHSLEWSTENRYEVNWRRHIEPVFGRMKLMDIRPAQVERWAKDLVSVKGLNEKSANGCLMLLKKLLSDGVRWEFIAHSPISGVKAMKEPERDFEFWTIAEGEKFLAYARDVNTGLYYAAALSLYTGMRLGEIQALKWDCIDLTRRVITVKRTYCLKRMEAKERTKTSKIRRIPIGSAVFELFMELRNAGECGDYVLKDFAYHHASRLLRETAEQAGVKSIRFHDLRHSFASNFVMRGGEIYKLQRLLGHTSIQMTERYSHLSPDHLQEASELLDYGTRRAMSLVDKKLTKKFVGEC